MLAHGGTAAPPPTGDRNRPSARWRSAAPEGGMRPGHRRENHLVREERAPFAGRGVIVLRAADKFVPAIRLADKAGATESGNRLALVLSARPEVVHFQGCQSPPGVSQR